MSGDVLVNGGVEEARARMIAGAPIVNGVETVALEDGAGRVLAEAIVAERDQPPFSASAMDGYALRGTDAPVQLRIVGESAAGRGFTRALEDGEAARIFTGAPLPIGADAVAIQEEVTRDGDILHAPATPRGQFVRPQGMDFVRGAMLLPAGARLDGVALSLAAAAGRTRLKVRARPRIALMATGDEIVAPGAEPGAHQIYDSISTGLAALITAWGGVATRLHPRADDVSVLASAAAEALAAHDLLVTIGGASVGDHDLVKPALATLQLKLAVERINMRPGKPVWFGRTDRGVVLGLPGNPASALVCAHLFLKPFIAHMMGADEALPFVRATLTSELPANGPREHYIRAALSIDEGGGARVTPFERQDSSLLAVFRDANALIRVAGNAPALATGALVDVLPLGR